MRSYRFLTVCLQFDRKINIFVTVCVAFMTEQRLSTFLQELGRNYNEQGSLLFELQITKVETFIIYLFRSKVPMPDEYIYI